MEDVYDLSLLNEGIGFVVWGERYKNSIIFYSEENEIDKLNDIMENSSKYSGVIQIKWYFKKNEPIEDSMPAEQISAQEMAKLVGRDFLARPSNLIRFHDSKEGLLEAITGEKKPEYLS